MTTIHENSLAAYHAGQLWMFEERQRIVLRAFEQLHEATDREVCEFLEFTEPNAVRPRITKLVDLGVLEEIGKRIDATTGRPVRVCRIVALHEALHEARQMALPMEAVA